MSKIRKHFAEMMPIYILGAIAGIGSAVILELVFGGYQKDCCTSCNIAPIQGDFYIIVCFCKKGRSREVPPFYLLCFLGILLRSRCVDHAALTRCLFLCGVDLAGLPPLVTSGHFSYWHTNKVFDNYRAENEKKCKKNQKKLKKVCKYKNRLYLCNNKNKQRYEKHKLLHNFRFRAFSNVQ